MSHVFDKPSLVQRVVPWLSGFDRPLTLAVLLLCGLGLVTMYSVGYDHGTRFVDHSRNMLIALAVVFVMAQISPQRLMSLAVPVYAVGVVLLVAVLLFGITKKGSTRWINVGVVIQPSEIMKIAMPLMLAWLVDFGVGVIEGHAGFHEQLAGRGFAHPDRAGQSENQHGGVRCAALLQTPTSPCPRRNASRGSSGRPRMVKWSPSIRSNRCTPNPSSW